MKKITIIFISFLFFYNYLEAVELEKKFDIYTFKADFVQKIFKDNKEIVYKGIIKAKRPSFLLWYYTYPISKKIYIVQDEIVIDEPDLEQAVITKSNKELNFFSLLKKAKKIDEQTYQAFISDINYTIKFDQNKLNSIIYEDEFSNIVEITFSNQKYDIKIPTKDFIFDPPKDYDIIHK